ncbi:hypothetical protein TOTORO_00930 [Serratia phage vB_SmaS-Totoro]|nr:hypothetical protein TOTORO_00930 [Serratia phage vB_SmaS-Totoro]
MKHTRNIIQNKREEFSCPAFESIAIPDYVNDAELATELEETRVGISDRLDESESLTDRADRMTDMTEFVEQQVNPAENTPINEVALIEQVTAANLDGTGIDVEEVMPSVESYVGSTVSVEGFKDKIKALVEAVSDLVESAKKAFTDFMKATFTRLGALKKRIQDIEGKLSSAEFPEVVDVPKGLAKRALVVGNDTIDNPSALSAALELFVKDLQSKGIGLSEMVANDYDDFVEIVVQAARNSGRGKDKDRLRAELRTKLTKQFNTFQKKAAALYKGNGKELGSFYVGANFGEQAADEKDIIGLARKTEVDIGPAANDHSRQVQFKGLNKSSATDILRKLKTVSGNLATFSKTNAMANIDWASAELSGVFTWILEGEDTRSLWSLINAVSRMYTRLYTGPVSSYTTQFFRVANAELDLIEKAIG